MIDAQPGQLVLGVIIIACLFAMWAAADHRPPLSLSRKRSETSSLQRAKAREGRRGTTKAHCLGASSVGQ